MTDEKRTDGDDARQFLIYGTSDGQTRIELRMQDETVWLSQKAMAELFQTSVPNINQHLSAIFSEGELAPEATIKKYLIVQKEGKREVSRQIDLYNLEAIIAVGYRVRSPRGTQFRVWATERFREYLVKGFTMDDDRLKRGGGGNYFDELLARVRDIRNSERVFWRKVAATKWRHDVAMGVSPWKRNPHHAISPEGTTGNVAQTTHVAPSGLAVCVVSRNHGFAPVATVCHPFGTLHSGGK